MSHYTTLDTIVLAVYMLGLMTLGILLSRRKQNDTLYNKNGTLGFFILTATVCATMVGGSDVIGTGAVAFRRSLDIFVMTLPYPLGVLIFSLLSGRIQRLGMRYGIRSIPQLMEKRFGRGARYLTAGIICFSTAATSAASISAMATIFNVIGDEVGISYTLAAIVATVALIVYTSCSGFSGVVWTDVIQFLILTAFVFVVLPIVTTAQGGGLKEIIAKATPEMLQVNIDGYFIGAIFVHIMFTFGAAEIWQRSFAAKTPKTATRGVAIGAIFFTVTLAVVCYLGLAGYSIFPTIESDYGTTDAIIPVLAIRLLPTGLTGLVLAGLFAVAMSSGDSYVQLASQTFAEDILHSIFPNMSRKKERLIFRLSIVVLALIGLAVALYIRAVFDVLMFALGFYSSCMAFPALGALLWKKTTKYGIYASILTGLAVAILWLILGEPFELNMALPSGIASLAALIGVSLATQKKHPSVVLDSH